MGAATNIEKDKTQNTYQTLWYVFVIQQKSVPTLLLTFIVKHPNSYFRLNFLENQEQTMTYLNPSSTSSRPLPPVVLCLLQEGPGTDDRITSLNSHSTVSPIPPLREFNDVTANRNRRQGISGP